MATFLVEAYEPRGRRDSVDRARAAIAGTEVRYLRSISVPDDETCFLVLEAPSADAVREVGERAALAWQRVVEAVPS